jgi:energy-coupling factor transporter ATP-binding protein EcfA2
MKLNKVRVTNFRSVEDSGDFDIGDLTCLVGKNEAGKTAILHALRGANPNDAFKYDQTRDYPRRFLSKFDERHPDGSSVVAKTYWTLDDNDVAALEAKLGKGCLSSREVVISRSIGTDTTVVGVQFNDPKSLEHFVAKHKLDATERSAIRASTGTKAAVATLAGIRTAD